MARGTRTNCHSMGSFKCEDAPSSGNMTTTCGCLHKVAKKRNPICDCRGGHMPNCNQCRLYDLFRRNNRALSEAYFTLLMNSCGNDFHRRGSNQLRMDNMVPSDRPPDEACKVVNVRNVLDNQLASNYIDVDASPQWVRGSLPDCAVGSGDGKKEKHTRKQERKRKGVSRLNGEVDHSNDGPPREEDPRGDERETVQRVAPGKSSHLFCEANKFGNSNGSEQGRRVYHVSSKDEQICVFPQEEQNSLEGIIMGSTSSMRSEDRNVDRPSQESSKDYHCHRSADGSNPNDAPPNRKKKKEKNSSSQKEFSGTNKQKRKKKKKKILNVQKYYESNSANLFWSDLRNLGIPQVEQLTGVAEMTQVERLTQVEQLTHAMHAGGGSREDGPIQDNQFGNVNLQSTHIKKYELRTKRKVKYAWPSIIKKLRRDDSRLVYDPFLYNSTWRIKKA
ncbi:hypothetical protein PVX_089000 [Plasmodium vivax]|uniref:Uncharacterized protein n=2 Tax=Plasmodium vivax TaxID=5855 RepID=A5K5H9_PLAVS|nr:hypothetical protein PVX_089000 [Plasmodium vivax]EDL45164.1 hypothetical protein PVX_089000 [Plasmodium vivax]KMZ88033.1 hypothetical protein PVBG_02494 [Plasmodium vivax Brazil I]|eukprot:XP_001614891.1 hypothetical protein [Plasmodium vivax Sal-1]